MPTLRLLPELEDALRHIQGVKAASVVTGPDAVPTEVHVLAAPGKPAKQVVRDVQSLALARYDIDIDHRIVSVVQMGDDEVRVPGQPSPALTPRRPSRADEAEPVDPAGHRGHHGAQRQGQTEASVTLAAGDQLVRGAQPGARRPLATGPGWSPSPPSTRSPSCSARPCEVESSTVVADRDHARSP